MQRPFSLLLFVALLFLSACSSKSDFYRLRPSLLKGGSTHPLHPQNVLGVGEVQLPDYLEKPEILTLQNNQQLHVHEEHRWVGSLDKNIQSVLTQNLSVLLPHASVLSSPWSEPLHDRYRLYISIDRFDGDAHGTVTLSGRWSLVDRESDEVVLGESFRYQEKGLPQTSALVATQDRLLERLSRRIAQKIHRYYP